MPQVIAVVGPGVCSLCLITTLQYLRKLSIFLVGICNADVLYNH